MSSLRAFRACFGLIAGLGLSSATWAADTTLKWSLKQGETLKYVLTHSSNIKVTQPSQELTKKLELTLDLAWKVNSVAADGTIELTQTLERARAKVTAPGAVVSFDSQDKNVRNAAIPADLKAYELVVNQPYALKLSPQGEIVDAKVPESVKSGIAGTPIAEEADTGSFFSDTGVKAFLNQAFPKLPKDPVDKGSTWTNETALAARGAKVVAKTTYELAEVSPLALIDASIDTSITIAPEAGFTLKVNKQSSSGKVTFSPSTGRLESSSMVHSTDSTIHDSTQNITADQTSETSFSVKLVK